MPQRSACRQNSTCAGMSGIPDCSVRACDHGAGRPQPRGSSGSGGVASWSLSPGESGQSDNNQSAGTSRLGTRSKPVSGVRLTTSIPRSRASRKKSLHPAAHAVVSSEALRETAVMDAGAVGVPALAGDHIQADVREPLEAAGGDPFAGPFRNGL